jgi:hypothetical protein
MEVPEFQTLEEFAEYVRVKIGRIEQSVYQKFGAESREFSTVAELLYVAHTIVQQAKMKSEQTGDYDLNALPRPVALDNEEDPESEEFKA